MKGRAYSPGFSLIEVLLSLAIITILVGLSAPIYASFQSRNDLEITTQGIANALRRAQVYARGVSGDSQWGVEVQASGATVFKGTTFASNPGSYETTTIPPGMSVSGLGEVLFTKLDGLPNTTGAIMLTSNANETRTITINAKGVVSY